jgi:hypothetical protein
MPFQIHITETEIKAFIPELSKMLWTGQDDYDAQRKKAIEYVCQELRDRGYTLPELMPEFIIRNNGNTIIDKEKTEAQGEDSLQRARYILQPVVLTPGANAEITIEGSFDISHWFTAAAFNINSASAVTGTFETQFSHYRVLTDVEHGTIDFRLYLVETGIEKLVIYKWLELILLDKYSREDDLYYLKMKYFRNEYESLFKSLRIHTDADGNGEAATNEFTKPGSVRILK